MKKILIVGAGGFGREVYTWINDSKNNYLNWQIIGFLDDDQLALQDYDYNKNIISSIADYEPEEDEYLVIAIGSPKGKEKLVNTLLEKGAKFETFIHKTAIIGKNVKLGTGSILCPNSIITCDATIGKYVTINCNSGIGHDAAIGDYSTLSAHVDVTGFVKLGERVFVGSNACILPKVTVSNDAVVGAGSVVTRNVKEGHTVFGNPAKSII